MFRLDSRPWSRRGIVECVRAVCEWRLSRGTHTFDSVAMYLRGGVLLAVARSTMGGFEAQYAQSL